MSDLSLGIKIVSHGGVGETRPATESSPSSIITNLTGSCHELMVCVQGEVRRVLVDMGAYQGLGYLDRNNDKLGAGVTAAVATHAHMDHIGEYPELFVDPDRIPSYPIYASSGTRDAMGIALPDAAKILLAEYNEAIAKSYQIHKAISWHLRTIHWYESKGRKNVSRDGKWWRVAETGTPIGEEKYNASKKFLAELRKAVAEKFGDVDFLNNTKNGAWKKDFAPTPLKYDLESVNRLLSQVKGVRQYNSWNDIVPGHLAFRLYNAGHILWAASVLFKITDPESRVEKHVLFTGDIGPYKADFHLSGIPTPPEEDIKIDAVMIESTYGGRPPRDFEAGKKEYENSVLNSVGLWNRGEYRQVIHACFSLDRMQNILFRLLQMKKSGRLQTPIYVDSVTGVAYIEQYRRQVEQELEELQNMKDANGKIDPSILPEKIRELVGATYFERQEKYLAEFLELVQPENYTVIDESNRTEIMINQSEVRIILTASGMANGGAITSYLQNYASDEKTAFYFPGYMAEGTIGHQLAVAQIKKLSIGWRQIEEVRARMKQFTFLSGHADESDLIAYLVSLNLSEYAKIFLVHGDISSSSPALKNTILREFPRNNRTIREDQIVVPGLGEVIDVFGNMDIPSRDISVDPKTKAPKYAHMIGFVFDYLKNHKDTEIEEGKQGSDTIKKSGWNSSRAPIISKSDNWHYPKKSGNAAHHSSEHLLQSAREKMAYLEKVTSELRSSWEAENSQLGIKVGDNLRTKPILSIRTAFEYLQKEPQHRVERNQVATQLNSAVQKQEEMTHIQSQIDAAKDPRKRSNLMGRLRWWDLVVNQQNIIKFTERLSMLDGVLAYIEDQWKFLQSFTDQDTVREYIRTWVAPSIVECTPEQIVTYKERAAKLRTEWESYNKILVVLAQEGEMQLEIDALNTIRGERTALEALLLNDDTLDEIDNRSIENKLRKMRTLKQIHEQILLYEDEYAKLQAERKWYANQFRTISKLQTPEDIREYILRGVIPARNADKRPKVEEKVFTSEIRSITDIKGKSLPDSVIKQTILDMIRASLQENELFQKRAELLNQVWDITKRIGKYKGVIEHLKSSDYLAERVELLLEDMIIQLQELNTLSQTLQREYSNDSLVVAECARWK